MAYRRYSKADTYHRLVAASRGFFDPLATAGQFRRPQTVDRRVLEAMVGVRPDRVLPTTAPENKRQQAMPRLLRRRPRADAACFASPRNRHFRGQGGMCGPPRPATAATAGTTRREAQSQMACQLEKTAYPAARTPIRSSSSQSVLPASDEASRLTQGHEITERRTVQFDKSIQVIEKTHIALLRTRQQSSELRAKSAFGQAFQNG
jgi:hypothetical protein